MCASSRATVGTRGTRRAGAQGLPLRSFLQPGCEAWGGPASPRKHDKIELMSQ